MSQELEPTETQPTGQIVVYAPTGAMDSLLLTLQQAMDATLSGDCSTGQAFAIAKLANSQTKALELAYRIYKEVAA